MLYTIFMQNVIEVEQLQKQYPLPRADRKDGKTFFEAVKGISFEVAKGEIFGILGPNGAGKTTTLEILEGLKKPTSGKITVLGLDAAKKVDEVKKRIGVQLQSSEYLPNLSLAEQVSMFAALYERTVDPIELLGFVGLADKAHEQVKNLSGGQKQRFTIATSLVNDPEILFLDEPTTGLDPRARRDLWKLVRDINAKGITIVLTTHYMEEAEYLCNRVAIMSKGLILTIDNPHTLINNLSHTTQVSFFTNDPVDGKLWEQMPEVEKVYGNYPKVILELTSLDHIGKIIQTLKDHSIEFSGFVVKTATLEDVYLDLTGHELEVEHA
jgi:ABC-2 type transport system ATP-binding protein